MRVALGQIDTAQGDLEGNGDRMLGAIRRAADGGADLVVFPELSLPGYCPKDLVYRPSFLAAVQRAEAKLAERLPDGITVVLGSLGSVGDAADRRPTNEAVCLTRGTVGERVGKRLLPSYDVFDESRWFQAAAAGRPVEIRGRSVGLTICEDIWAHADASDPGMPAYAVDPAADLVRAGAEIIINLSASPYDLGKPHRREKVVTDLARRLKRPVVQVNLVGGNDELIFDGHSVVVSADGRVVARAAGFAEDLLTIDPFFESTEEAAPLPQAPEEELRRALVLGLRDYVLKSGFTGVVLGLSGGVDSAVTAAIAAEAVGPENVMGVALPSRYSAEMSTMDAAELAHRLAIEFTTMSIEPAFAAMLETLAPSFAGMAEDVTEENLQPRIRGALLMALANKFRRIVLTTGNKSELAVGYCTLYGDLCGGLGVLADVPKTMVYRLARHLNATRGNPIPERTIHRAPSAELKPDQRDSDSLPDYERLDDILSRAIESRQSATDIIRAGHREDEVRGVLEKLWQNEYKRKQMPPGLRVTSKAFGTGRRMPIVGARRWFENLSSESPKE